jgi:hypothetical protein
LGMSLQLELSERHPGNEPVERQLATHVADAVVTGFPDEPFTELPRSRGLHSGAPPFPVPDGPAVARRPTGSRIASHVASRDAAPLTGPLWAAVTRSPLTASPGLAAMGNSSPAYG